MTSVTAYPLAWPPEYERTPDHERRWWPSHPKPARGRARDQVYDELWTSGADSIVISTDIQLRQDGEFYASAKEPDDPGVVVYFQLHGQPRVMACDAYRKVAWNLRALALTIGDLRRIEKRGVNDFSRRVYDGFKALPESTGVAWSDVLGVAHHATVDEIKNAYRKLAKAAHPDRSGGRDAWDRLQAAYQQGLQARRS